MYALRIALWMFYLFPIDEYKFVFVAGTKKKLFICNPKYIFEYLYNTYGYKYSYIWCLEDKKILPSKYKKIKTVKFLSFGYVYHVMTAKYIITNGGIEPFFPIRKLQVVVNTWHGGGAYKKSDMNMPLFKSRLWSMRIMKNIRSMMTTYMVSSCEKFSYFFNKDLDISEKKFMNIGMPRNDIFFNDLNLIRRKVMEYLKIDNNSKIVLYAPTFRGDSHNVEEFKHSIDVEKVLVSLKKVYIKNFLFLYRSHNRFLQNKYNVELQDCISVSDYPDMQELLCAADVLITDYSSCMWDFSLTFRPCFIYVPDLTKYNTDRGFYTPIEKWPFPVAETNEQLVYNILNFNEGKYRNDVKQHHLDLGSFERGTATKQFCQILFGNGKI
jgi:CDP-glycerol glycerophosphotransferase